MRADPSLNSQSPTRDQWAWLEVKGKHFSCYICDYYLSAFFSLLQPLGLGMPVLWMTITSSSRRRCSFCSSMRFCRSCNSCLLCSSGSLRWAASWACCLLWASVRSLFSCCSRWKSRLRVDSPGTFSIELLTKIGVMNEGNDTSWWCYSTWTEMIRYLDSLSSPRFSSSSSLPLYSYSVSSIRRIGGGQKEVKILQQQIL